MISVRSDRADMVLSGKIIKDNEIIKNVTVEVDEEGLPFNLKLEKAFSDLCRELKIPLPMWLGKNTKEFVHFRITHFNSDQFTEEVSFNRFEVELDSM
jgi:hypothetical protein